MPKIKNKWIINFFEVMEWRYIRGKQIPVYTKQERKIRRIENFIDNCQNASLKSKKGKRSK